MRANERTSGRVGIDAGEARTLPRAAAFQIALVPTQLLV